MSVLISPFTGFLFWNDLENTLLICSVEFITKSLSSYFPLILSMHYFILSSAIILFSNATFQSNVLLSTNTESTIIFAYLLVIDFADTIFVFVGICALLFLVKINNFRFIMIFILFVFYVTFFVFSSFYNVSIDKIFFFPEYFVLFSSELFSSYY